MDPRDLARDKLDRNTAAKSVVVSLKIWAGFITVAGGISTSLFVANHIGFAVYLAILLSSLVIMPISYAIIGLHQLHETRSDLTKVLESERSTDLLLADARKERDQALTDLQALKGQLALERNAAGLFVAVNAEASLKTEPQPQNRMTDND